MIFSTEEISAHIQRNHGIPKETADGIASGISHAFSQIDPATSKDIERLEKEISGLKESTTKDIAGLKQYVDTRFDAIDARFDAIDTKFDAIDTKFDAQLAKLSSATKTIVITILLSVIVLLARPYVMPDPNIQPLPQAQAGNQPTR